MEGLAINSTAFINLIGVRLSDTIHLKNNTISELSQKSGVSISQIYKIRSGKCDTTIVTLFKILTALQVSLESFFNFNIQVDQLLKYSNSIYSHNEALEVLTTNLKIQQLKLSRIKSLTQTNLAYKLGYTNYKYVNCLLNGRGADYINLKTSTLFNLSKELGLDDKIHYLFKPQGGN